MIVINTVSDTKFSFNGITYHKNFMPFVTGDKIAILNVYDACITLTDAPTHFSEYVVNGVTYTSVETLQAALLDIIYTRVSLGSGGSGTVTSVSGTGTVSGITLSGTVTTSGSLTLGGTLSLTSGQIISGLGFTPYDATNPAGYITSAALTGYVTLGTAQTITGAKTLTSLLTGTRANFASSGSDNTLVINHSSGSGIGLSITKGGNGEGLYVNKTSGTGNAATIVGTLNATTLVKNGGTSSQFLKADGSVDSSVYLTSTSLDPLEFNITDRTVWNNGKGNVVTNTSFGEFALRNNTTGDWNTSYGYQALTTNVGGSKNTAIGMNAISSAGSGSFNTAIGANAGALKFGGTILQIVDNSVFVGYNSRALDDNQTNQIVIGANANGNGSNSVTLGNDSITKTILKGNVGIGTTSPTTKLAVNGNFSSQLSDANDIRLIIAPTTSLIQIAATYNTTGSFQPLGFFTSDTERMRITSGGNVLIGTTSDNGSKLQVQGNTTSGISYRIGTYTNGSTTPSVSGISFLSISNSSATSITNFTGAVDGQIITLQFSDSNTTITRNNAYLSLGLNFTSTANDTITLIYLSGLWYEVSRSVNS